jgi:hypothetical protein
VSKIVTEYLRSSGDSELFVKAMEGTATVEDLYQRLLISLEQQTLMGQFKGIADGSPY